MLSLKKFCKKLLGISLAALFLVPAFGQPKLKITDFIVFAGKKTPPPGSGDVGVFLGLSTETGKGSLGSYQLVKSIGSSEIGGSIHSGGKIDMGIANRVAGSMNSLGSITMGIGASVAGNINSRGNIFISLGQVKGTVTHPVGTTYLGPVPAGGNIIANPVLPVLPEMPAITSFNANVNTNITNSATLTPGTYGNVKYSGGKTLKLKGPGVYIFKSIKNSGINPFVFDFNGQPAGYFKIYIEGDVDLGNSNMTLIGGDPSHIYFETHGNGSTCDEKGVAWNIDNGAGGLLRMAGSVWAPYGAINIGIGTSLAKVKGALWSGTRVRLQAGVNVEFSAYSGFNDNDSLILPGYEPPAGGKSADIIGPELSALCQNLNSGILPSPYIYRVIDQSIIIEVVAIVGHYQAALTRLTNMYAMTGFIDNGLNSLVITGKIPINNVCLLNADAVLKTHVNSIRPLYPPITSSGAAGSSGDTSVHANKVRDAYNLHGTGIKVGVISDGFNTIPDDPAATNVVNGDLPVVEVLKDYPYGRTLDEGRAMLQIVHDLAPASPLAFRSGFISEGDFAKGIISMQEAGCKVIADDITYITAPFFKDGLAAKAVDSVKKKGVSYFTAAGNFGAKSYEAFFNSTPAPSGVTGMAHNFGGGDIFQNDSLKPGPYTIVMQWEDSIYSLGQGGALNDFDIYLTNDDGSIRFGMNRFNIGADPTEVLPFTVTGNTKTNIMVVRASGTGPANVKFKFIVFRGDLKFNEYETGTSTIVGQANAKGAMAVAAARYTRTPAFGVTPALVETFSSVGGTPVYGSVRQKPDFTAPDGVNTTVDFGSLNIEGDLFPNFFGTSAAAPHAAAVAALILEGKKKFYNKVLEPDSIKWYLGNKALDMATAGFDKLTGYGLIQADSVVHSFAKPTPQLDALIKAPAVVPGTVVFTTTLKGNYFEPASVVMLNGIAVPTTYVNSTEATAIIPLFIGNPKVTVYTPPVTPSGLDGGYSDTLYFYNTIKTKIVVTAENKTKKYGEALPVFTSSILVNNVPLAQTGLTLANLMLNPITYTSSATSASNVGIYLIEPAMKTLSSADSAIFELYEFTFKKGLLANTKMPLLVTPKDTTLTYGDKIAGFKFIYSYDDSKIPAAQKANYLNNIGVLHDQTIDNDVVALVDAKTILNGRSLTDADLVTMSVMASAQSILNARTILNGQTILNGVVVNDTTRIVDLSVQSIYNYQLDSSSSPLVSAQTILNGQTILNARTILNAQSILNGTAVVNGQTILNGMTILNGNTVGDTSNNNVVVIIDEDDVTGPANTIPTFKSINLITGVTVGKFTIVPAALLSDNFEIRYGLGELTIDPTALQVTANNAAMITLDTLPKFTATVSGLKNGDSVLGGPSFALSPAYLGLAGNYSIVPSALQLEFPENYAITYSPGNLSVTQSVNKIIDLKPRLICVEELADDPNGFGFVANFGYLNPNSKPVYIPRGIYNFMVGTTNTSGLAPEIFLPGEGTFQVKFDGAVLRWVLKTNKIFVYTDSAYGAIAGGCTAKKAKVSRAVKPDPGEPVASQVSAYPNPTKGKVMLSAKKGIMDSKDLLIMDPAGKRYNATNTRRISPNSIEVDLTNSTGKGMYFIKVKVDDAYQVFRVIKQ